MSIDVDVYASRPATAVELAGVVEGVPGLGVESLTGGGGAVVVRGARRSYCCTVEGPLSVEPAEIPDEIVAAVVGVAVQYRVLVEGSSAADVAPAKRLARGLARVLGGAVFDAQSDTVWSPGSGRKVVAPAREERVRVIDVVWCFAGDRVSDRTLRGFLALCRRHLPEAVPRRFGTFEPLQGRFAELGEDGLVEVWSRSNDAWSEVFWKAQLPCAGGTISGPPDARVRPAWRVGLTFLSQPFETDPGWRNALRSLVVAVAEELGAFYACAQLTGQHIWARNGLWGDQRTESPSRVGGSWWRGLPPHPVWWAWYGRDYAQILGAVLDPGEVTMTATGLLHMAAERPRTHDELVAASVFTPADELVAGYNGRPAGRIPAALEVLAGKRSEDDAEYINHDPEQRWHREFVNTRLAGQQVVVEQLSHNGFPVDDFHSIRSALVARRADNGAGIRVLLDALDSDLPQYVKEDVVFELCVARTAAAGAWPQLRDRYIGEPAASDFKIHLANALADTVTRPQLPALVQLANDSSQGPSRAKLIGALKRFKDPDAAQAAERLSNEIDLRPDPQDI